MRLTPQSVRNYVTHLQNQVNKGRGHSSTLKKKIEDLKEALRMIECNVHFGIGDQTQRNNDLNSRALRKMANAVTTCAGNHIDIHRDKKELPDLLEDGDHILPPTLEWRIEFPTEPGDYMIDGRSSMLPLQHVHVVNGPPNDIDHLRVELGEGALRGTGHVWVEEVPVYWYGPIPRCPFNEFRRMPTGDDDAENTD